MQKTGIYILIFILSITICLFGFQYGPKNEPNAYYKVYLKDELIGTIESKKELQDYINNQTDTIRKNVKDYQIKIDSYNTFEKLISKNNLNFSSNKEKARELLSNQKLYNLSDIDMDNLSHYLDEKIYNYDINYINEMKEYVNSNEIYTHVNEVYIPNNIDIKKVYTYENNIEDVATIYKKIISKESCSIAGYKFVIKSVDEGKEDLIIYTLDKEIMTDAIEKLITIFIDENEYKKYKNSTQEEIVTTGSRIENIYVENDLTYRAVNVSVNEKIYTDSKSLSAFLLYGDEYNERTVTINPGDSIESVSFDNQISVQEFLIFNPQYTSRDNLLVPGTEAIISTIDPKIRIVVEKYEVVDRETNFATVEQYDESMIQGNMEVVQEGENGLERVSQNVKSINGQISFVDPVDKENIKTSVSKIIKVGTRYVPNVGSTSSWGWPTDSGYTFSSYYGYRPAVFGSSWHSGLDIAGTGYGSNIYAANNVEIVTMKYDGSYGYHIIINHNNGYYSLYAHMSRFASGLSVGSTVERGQIIGYVGSTGASTGPHLHFEIRTCLQFNCTTNPLSYY